MGEATPPRNRDQDIPTKNGEELGEREPLMPKPGPEGEKRNQPLPEEETYERDRHQRPLGEGPPAQD